MPSVTRLLDAPAMARSLERIAGEVVEKCGGTEGLVLVGIQRRGVELAARLASLIRERGARKTGSGEPGAGSGGSIPLGKLDITLYRDDLSAVGPIPRVGITSLPDDLEGRTVVIVDDVLYTGRTVRAALDELADFGRPRRVLLCVLVDRGGRELPIQADFVGLTVETGPDDRVDVAVTELDGHDAVDLVRRGPL